MEVSNQSHPGNFFT